VITVTGTGTSLNDSNSCEAEITWTCNNSSSESWLYGFASLFGPGVVGAESCVVGADGVGCAGGVDSTGCVDAAETDPASVASTASEAGAGCAHARVAPAARITSPSLDTNSDVLVVGKTSPLSDENPNYWTCTKELES
jgi:hypothetical protein